MDSRISETARSRRSLIGVDVGPYRIVEELGSGGMGTVYKGIDRELDRPVALKILFDLDDPENIDRFRREAKALGRLGHPNTIQIYWVGEVDGYPCFAMEYCAGGISVYDLLKERGVLPVEAAVDIVVQTAQGLEAARQAGIVHRDIKPNNLLIAEDGTIKIADFGLARFTADTNNQLTQSGIIVGTPYYMSPEQGQGEPIDHRADQYSLGSTFFHMITGFTPYEAENPVSLIIKHVREPIPDLRQVSPSVPDPLRLIIERMMAKSREDRYDDYEQLLEDLRHFQEGQELVHAHRRPRARLTTGSIPVWLYVVAGILLGTGLMAGLSRLGRIAGNTTSTATPLAETSVTPDATGSPAPTATSHRVAVVVPGVEPSSPLGRVVADLGDEDVAMRVRAAVALGRQRDMRTVPALATLVERDPDFDVRARAAWALGEIRSQKATPTLVAALRTEDVPLTLAAIAALRRLNDVRAVEPLKALATDHADARVRREAGTAHSALFSVSDDGPHVGGHPAGWWQTQFRDLRDSADESGRRARNLQTAAQYYEERYGFSSVTDASLLGPDAREVFVTVYTAALTDAAVARRDEETARRALRRLTADADAKGVPPDWRG